MFDLASSMNFFESSPLVSYLWSNSKKFCLHMCIKDAKANFGKLGILLLLSFEAFFDYMYKVSQTLFLLILLLYFTSCLLLGSIFHMP